MLLITTSRLNLLIQTYVLTKLAEASTRLFGGVSSKTDSWLKTASNCTIYLSMSYVFFFNKITKGDCKLREENML